MPFHLFPVCVKLNGSRAVAFLADGDVDALHAASGRLLRAEEEACLTACGAVHVGIGHNVLKRRIQDEPATCWCCRRAGDLAVMRDPLRGALRLPRLVQRGAGEDVVCPETGAGSPGRCDGDGQRCGSQDAIALHACLRGTNSNMPAAPQGTGFRARFRQGESSWWAKPLSIASFVKCS